MGMSVYSEDSGRCSSLSDRLDTLSDVEEEDFNDYVEEPNKQGESCNHQVNILLSNYELLVNGAANKIQQLNEEKYDLEKKNKSLKKEVDKNMDKLENVRKAIDQGQKAHENLVETNRRLVKVV